MEFRVVSALLINFCESIGYPSGCAGTKRVVLESFHEVDDEVSGESRRLCNDG